MGEAAGVQVRRRREASRRCEVLHDGRRDPIDKPHPQPIIEVRAIGPRRTVEFTGCDRAVAAAIRTLGARHQRALHCKAWLVQEHDAADVLALLEIRGYTIAVTL